MINWDFKDEIIYQDEVVTEDSRKFEILVYKYLKETYPLQNWKLTKATRDGNRDIENICEFSGTSMWVEVKYTFRLFTSLNCSITLYNACNCLKENLHISLNTPLANILSIQLHHFLKVRDIAPTAHLP